MRIKLNKLTAELVGTLLGDGSFYMSGYNNEVDIALNVRDKNHKNYVKKLLENVTGSSVTEKYPATSNCVHLRISKKSPVENLLKISLIKPGNKIKNKVTIPDWVWKNPQFVSSCLRGLIDTDGCIYKMQPQWPNLFQISFKNNDTRLLKDTRRAFMELGFHPSKVFGNRIVLTRQNEIKKYHDTIGTNNDRNIAIFQEFESIYKQR